MKYIINRSNFRQFDIAEINKLSPRAYFIPYGSKKALLEQNVLTERYNSSMVTLLNGEWDFKYYEKDMLIPNEFYTDRIQFDKVNVPSTWQRTGYREPCYLNTRYEFDPKLYPEMPQDVAMGIYRKTINIDNIEKVHIITFLGVISSLDLYVNGQFVGYSEGAHNSAEFDISEYLVSGENEIIASVSKWSTGTYLECQDMFRENGIFRDVLLTELDKTYLYDFGVKTEKNNGKYDLTVQAEIKGDIEKCSLCCELFDGEKCIASKEVEAHGKTTLSFENLDVVEWNAEEPYVYDLIITLNKDGKAITFVKNVTGFKTVEIIGNVYYFNGKPIKFKGVNHHDTNMHNGYVLKGEEIKSEMELMKKFNVNSIRTSHYPPDPTLLTLADLMGFYVIDEADIETHGAGDITVPYNNCLISDDPKWAPRYVDRVSRMYCRDKNHVCISMWSLGNEAWGYYCQDECYQYLKGTGTKIPVHYESVIHTKRFAYDVISEMYPSQENVASYGAGTAKDKRYSEKPYFMCEYVHAMGVGPGGAEEYWDSIYKYDNLMGGCVWEWADHAVYHNGNDKYKVKYTYGGDHGEEKHDGNFCVDGMLYPDKTPHTAAYVIKAIYRPVRSKYISGKCFEFTNTNRFKNTKYLSVKWSQLINGTEIKNGVLTLDIEPMKTKTYEIPFNSYSLSDDCFINIEYYDGDNRVGIEQTVINDKAVFETEHSRVGLISTSHNGNSYTVEFENGKIVFNRKTGEITDYIKNGFEFFNTKPVDSRRGIIPNIVRASFDNDSYGEPEKPWMKIKLHDAETVIKNFECVNKSYCAKVAVYYIVKKGLKTFFHINVVYTVYGDGFVGVEAKLEKAMFGCKEIQRFGVTVELAADLKNIEFYGKGSDEKMENLCDLNAHATMGIWETTVEAMHEPYVMPQDNGNCGGVKYLKLSNGENTLTVYGEPKFSFSAHNYTQKCLAEAKHQEEISFEKTTFLSVDGFVRGTGTNTCGPDTLEKYRVKTDKPLMFKFGFKGE